MIADKYCFFSLLIASLLTRCKPQQDPNNGSGLEEMAGEEAPPPGYETTTLAFPEASGSDSLRMNMEVKYPESSRLKKKLTKNPGGGGGGGVDVLQN